MLVCSLQANQSSVHSLPFASSELNIFTGHKNLHAQSKQMNWEIHQIKAPFYIMCMIKVELSSFVTCNKIY